MALTNHKQNNVYTKNSKETEERQPNKDVCIISNAQELKRAIEMLKSYVKNSNYSNRGRNLLFSRSLVQCSYL